MSSNDEEVTQPSASAPVPSPPPTVPDPPPTDPRGLPLTGADEPGVRDLLLAFRDDWQTWKVQNDDKMSGLTGGMKLLDARQTVIESDLRQLRSDVATAKAEASGARERADTAHTMAQTASFAAGRASQDNEAGQETLLAALATTRGELQTATAAIGTLRTSDDELKAMVQKAAQDSAGAAIREVLGRAAKHPRLMKALEIIATVIALVVAQKYAPQLIPGLTPTVQAVEKESP